MKACGSSRINRGFGSLRGRSAPHRGFGLLHVSALSVLLILMAGCVTEYSGGTQMSSDPDAALDKRVALARQYIGVGDWENAKRNLELAQEVDPNNAEVFEAFALVYQSTGEFEMAENQFRAALKAEPTLSRARNNCAAFLYSQGRYIEAEREFYRVTEDTLYSGRPMVFVNLGLCRLQLEDDAGAEAAFTRALSMDRRNPVALLEMGFLRLEAGDTNEAARYHGTYRTVSPQQFPGGCYSVWKSPIKQATRMRWVVMS